MAELLLTEGRGGRLIALTGDSIDDEFGSPGSGVGEFNQPSAVALKPFGGFLVADRGNDRLASFANFSGFGWKTFGSTGTGDFELRRPSGVAFDANGRMWIADSGNRRVAVINQFDGSGWTTFGTSGRPTPSDPAVGAFWDPFEIAVGPSGEILVADPGAGRVVRIDGIDGSGWATTAFGALRSPLSVVPYGTGYAVADFGAGRVVVLDAGLEVRRATIDVRLSGVAAVRVDSGDLVALVPPLGIVVVLVDDGSEIAVVDVVRLEPLGIREPLALEVA